MTAAARDPRLCPVCGAGRLVAEARPLRRLHRLLELSRMPLHPRLRAGSNGEGEQRRRLPDTRARQRSRRAACRVSLKKGPYGHYVQLGEGDNGEKPKRVVAAQGHDARRRRSRDGAASCWRCRARSAATPRRRADHRRDRPLRPLYQARHVIHLARRRRRRADDRPQPRGEPAGRSQDRRRGAARIAARARAASRRRPVELYRGRYGPYVSHDGVNASLPKGADPESFALDRAVELLAAQRAKGKGKAKARRPARSAAPAKAAANGVRRRRLRSRRPGRKRKRSARKAAAKPKRPAAAE